MTFRPAWLRLAVALSATVAFGASGGCSFFYDLNTTQCEVTADCRAFGSQFARATCVNRVCVEMNGGETGGSTTGGRSGTGAMGGVVAAGGYGGTAGGGAAGGDGGMGGEGGAVPLPECTTNAECIEANLDQPYICRNQKCVELLTDECPLLLPTNGAVTLLKDKIPPVVLGGFASMTNAQDRRDTKAVINWDLAFNEFDTVLSVPGTKQPRVVGLICQGAASLIDLEAEMTHLTHHVGVPAILSTLSSDDLAGAWEFTQTPEYVEAKLKPVFFMSTGSADLRLANLDDGGLVWHLLGDPRVLAATTASLVKHIEPHVQALRQSYFTENEGKPGVEDPALVPLRVTLVYNDDPTLADIASVLTTPDEERPGAMLTFNGAPAIDTINRDNYRQVKIESAKYHATPPPIIDNGITELQQNPPHIVVGMATSELGSVMSTVEGSWGKPGTASQGKPRPFYVLSHFILSAASETPIQAALSQYATTVPPIHLRSVGVAYALAQDAHSKSLYNSYLAKLRASYTGALDVAGSENHYDGAYSLLYAVMASAPFTRNEPDGNEVNSGWQERVIARTGGTSVDVGQANIADTVVKLSTATYRMSLWGTMGPPAFDRLSGTRTSATSVWCMLSNSNTLVWEAQIDGLIYDPEKSELTSPAGGVPSCLAQY